MQFYVSETYGIMSLDIIPPEAKRSGIGCQSATPYSRSEYGILQNVENGFWAESPEYIADRFMEETQQ